MELDFFGSTGTLVASVTGATTASDGLWHHVAGVWDGSQMRVYLDGNQNGLKKSTVAPNFGTGATGSGRVAEQQPDKFLQRVDR